MLNAAYGIVAVLLAAFVIARRTLVRRARPARSQEVTHRSDAEPSQHLGIGGPRPNYRTSPSTISKGMRVFVSRLHAERAQRRLEQREFQTWLEITSEPF
ncbi:hypothetical protein OKHIL_04780 [Mycolicibacterium mageritense]|nr:hypothetical protein MTY414_29400 [Mycolicibacterium mageritense]